MALYSNGNVTKFATSIVAGGFLCIAITFFLIAATIVLSLIPLYTPNHGEEGFGERKYAL